METVKSEVTIENENLFRALVCIPVAALFALLAASSIMNSGILLFQIIFVLLALYFTLSTLAYAAHYTNERYEGTTEPQFSNKNLSKTVKLLPLAIIFVIVAMTSITSSTHVVFQVLFVLMALFTVLSTLAYAAYFTNDYFEENAG